MSSQAPTSGPASGPAPARGTILCAFIGGIYNLRASIEHREALTKSSPIPRDEIEALSEHIWETKVEFARQIRNWSEPVGQMILANLYVALVGTLPHEDGSIP
ncbi:hypothetical protein N7519_008643 [Penicillium mononematosum]|uniref:uncharacterized protein n=1 Tax=Penicillium mononematosum TaxID=268346 RepID=UPI0025495FBF|nr:uncharacterized protein N7519_008643 [Penicillium mononematosum]KAJ6178182.1 hypothetical protein N7519_008643 [Penicillium mononematosum]